MCGIIFSQSFKNKPVNDRVYEQFNYQRSRGVDGFGLFDAEHNHLVRAVKEERIVNWLAKNKNQSTMILFHHRQPTSTINTRRANHPFTTGKYFGKTEYVLIHNGHISNAGDLFVDHQELGIEYTSLLEDMTFTDSEALLWDFALVMEGKQTELKATGGNAMICLKLVDGKPRNLFFGRNSNPLYITKDGDELHLSSQGLDVSEMRGSGKEEKMIDMHTLYRWSFGNHHLQKKHFLFPQFKPYTPNTGKKWDSLIDADDPYYFTPDYLRLSKKERKSFRKQLRRYNHDSNRGDRAYTPGSHAANAFKTEIPRVPHKTPSNASTATPDLVSAVKRARGLTPQQNRSEGSQNVTSEEVDTRCVTFLAAHAGNFEAAHSAMGRDLHTLRQQFPSDANLHARVALARAMNRLYDDPEWVDKTSVSSIWRALWQNKQQLLLAA